MARYPDSITVSATSGLPPIDLPDRSVEKADTSISGTLDPTTLQSIPIQGRDVLWIGGDCDKAGSISLLVTYFNSSGAVLGTSQGVGLNTGTGVAIAGRLPAVGPPLILGVSGVASITIAITSIVGSWKLRLRLI